MKSQEVSNRKFSQTKSYRTLEEIKKGCGKELIYYAPLTEPINCGEYVDNERKLCKTCQELLEQAIEFEKEHIKELWEAQNIAKQQQSQEFRKMIEELNKYTSNQIIHSGLSISPELNRDEFYEKRWVEYDKLLKEVQEGDNGK